MVSSFFKTRSARARYRQCVLSLEEIVAGRDRGGQDKAFEARFKALLAELTKTGDELIEAVVECLTSGTSMDKDAILEKIENDMELRKRFIDIGFYL